MAYSLYQRILGALIGAAAGDGMGAATEGRSTEQIIAHFGHAVSDFETPPQDTFGAGNVPGQATDDFSSAWFLAQSIADNQGQVDQEAVKRALVEWSHHSVFFDRFAGPTTRFAIKRFEGEEIPQSGGVKLLSRQATNGAAMRVSPLGMFNPGLLERTVEDTVTVTLLTHDNYLAISGACAVSCAVSRALLPDADLYGVLQAALWGARRGAARGRQIAHDVAGPTVVARLEKALAIGLGQGSPEQKMRKLGDCIGAGLHVSEAVPCAIGLVAANPGDPLGALTGAVNIGYDTDTIATMTGAIVGALQGAEGWPPHYLPTLEQANGLPLTPLAGKISTIAAIRMQEVLA